ncbi:glycoside hydrolase family 9 protein [Sinomicrobium sp. M5D2P9]
MKSHILIWVALAMCIMPVRAQEADSLFRINQLEYLERRGANVMLAHDFYPESHQGGVGIIQNDIRIATNGDLRLEPTPGQWQPVPKVGERQVNRKDSTISVRMHYPDPGKDRKGFNPIVYPDLNMSYTLKIKPQGKSFLITVDLDAPLPEEWEGKVGINLELFPGILFGKSYYMDNDFGIFNRQANGPGYYDEGGKYRMRPMAEGKTLVVCPEVPKQRLTITNLKDNRLQLLDGRAEHSNGWFVVRSPVPAGDTKNAIEWLVTPNAIENYTYDPVVQVSQVGYHPRQSKTAIIEKDKRDSVPGKATLLRIEPDGSLKKMIEQTPESWGDFLRFHYDRFDFTHITEPGMYMVRYGNYTTEPFRISHDVYDRNVWQPTLEYFLPVQMCHMRINDRYKVWHGRCHLDDARMAPVNHNHFDGYIQGPETLTTFKPGKHVPGINVGGWHDAGDYDLRVESQAATVQGLSRIYELFGIDYDNTSIDQETRTVEMLRPDGKADILQQVEHGLLSIVGGYKSLGRFYRGIIVPEKRQYVLLGDPLNHSDNVPYTGENPAVPIGQPGAPDDRWVFTEDNPSRELHTAAALATAARTMSGYNDKLAGECVEIAENIWTITTPEDPLQKIELAVELLLTTDKEKYARFLTNNQKVITENIAGTGWLTGMVLHRIKDRKFVKAVTKAVEQYYHEVEQMSRKTPYGMPYEPDIWGAGWGIQNFGMKQYFFHTGFPDIFPETYMLDALNFVLGAHPGANTSSFASGVGSRSLTQAYGINRGEASHIPGGIGSGTALIRPDFPELLEWPYLWQQTEYVLGGGTTDYLFLVLAADHILNNKK